jgi:hypothetical protein
VSITGLSTTATGTVLTLTDSASTSTVNLIIDNQKEIRFRETTANGTNYVALKAPASVSADLTFTLPATDGTANQVLTTSGAGVLSFTNPPTGFRNIVINGDMQIAQRNTSVASITANGYFTLDRWFLPISNLGTFTMSQSTDVPSGYGFAKSLKLDCTTADASPSAGDFMTLSQYFEGQNLQYLKKGTANAVSLTASFWVKSTKTGTFICELRDSDNTRSVSKSYTVSVSNTWEFKTVTFPADTSGALDNDNAKSFELDFWLGAGTTWTSGTLQTTWGTLTNANIAVGQVNIADSTSNDFLITGVQLEAGTSATDFEFLPIDVSLGRCQRYFEILGSSASALNAYVVGCVGSATAVAGIIWFQAQKRATPTITASGAWYSLPQNLTAVPTFDVGNNYNATLIQTSSGLTVGQASFIYDGGIGTSRVSISAEL